MEYLALDLEATGLDPERDRIVEFCVVRLDGELHELERWSELVLPGIPIPDPVVAIHGIRDSDVEGRPPFTAFAERMQELVTPRILIAYNHSFDRDLLHYELQRAGQPGVAIDHPFIDPFQIYRRNHPHTLAGALRHYVGRGLPDAHRAEVDTDAMLDVLRAQRAMRQVPPDLQGAVEVPEKQWLDRARRIYRDDTGEVRLGFGKYRDQLLRDRSDYARWMLSADFPMDTKRAISSLLEQWEAQRSGGRGDSGRFRGGARTTQADGAAKLAGHR